MLGHGVRCVWAAGAARRLIREPGRWVQAERLNAPHPRPPCAPGRKGWRRQAPASAAPHAATAACALGRAAPSHLGAQVRRCQVPASLRGKRALVAPAPLLDTPDSTPGFRFTSLLLSLARARGGGGTRSCPASPDGAVMALRGRATAGAPSPPALCPPSISPTGRGRPRQPRGSPTGRRGGGACSPRPARGL